MKRSLIPLFVAITTSSALAQTTWTGATSGSWETATNWSGGAVPVFTTPVVFGAASTQNLSTTSSGRAVQGITVTSPLTDVSITLTGPLTVNAGGINMSAAEKDLTISRSGFAAITIGATQTWNIASGRTLKISTTTGAQQNEKDLTTLNLLGAGTLNMDAAAWHMAALTASQTSVTTTTNFELANVDVRGNLSGNFTTKDGVSVLSNINLKSGAVTVGGDRCAGWERR